MQKGGSSLSASFYEGERADGPWVLGIAARMPGMANALDWLGQFPELETLDAPAREILTTAEEVGFDPG